MMRCCLALLVCLLSAALVQADAPAAGSSAEAASEAQRAKDERIVQAVLRLPGVKLDTKPEAKAAVLRHLARIEGEEKYFELVAKLQLAADVAPSLLKQTLAQPEANVGVNCAALLVKAAQIELLKQQLADDKAAAPLATALGLTGLPEAVPLVAPVIDDAERPVAVRVAAVRALGKLPGGERLLVEQVSAGKLASDLKFAAATVLLSSTDETIKQQASQHLSLPATADAQPLPPLAQLVAAQGDATAGKQVFMEKGTCAKCHVVNGEGKEVGPNLSEIGSKLSKEALYLSILDPSAGVSFNYETSQIVTAEGQIVVGIVVSDTAESLTLKTADAITRVFPKDEVDEVNRIKISLMPADLQRQLTAQDLVNVVEYLTTLKKP
jgi:putative heme-binding domain-containing protein